MKQLLCAHSTGERITQPQKKYIWASVRLQVPEMPAIIAGSIYHYGGTWEIFTCNGCKWVLA